MMWESQWGRQRKSILPVEPQSRGLKRKLFKPEGGLEKARKLGETYTEGQMVEIDNELNKVRLEQVRLETAAREHMPIYGRGSSNALKREARFSPDLAGRMKIWFTDKYASAVGEAGETAEGEEEYDQVWERNTLVARRCLGKGRPEDKLVLDAAIWNIQCSEEERRGMPMEVEEHGARDDSGRVFRVPSSSKCNSGGGLRREERRSVENINLNHTHNRNTKQLEYLKIASLSRISNPSPEPCSRIDVIKHINFKTFNYNLEESETMEWSNARARLGGRLKKKKVLIWSQM